MFGEGCEQIGDDGFVDVRRQRDAEASGTLRNSRRTYCPDIETSALQIGGKRNSCLIGADNHRKNMRTGGLDVATTAKLAPRELNQTRKPMPAVGIGSGEFEGCACDRGDERRRGGRENKRAGTVDEKVADRSRRKDKAADRPERLAASVQCDDVVTALKGCGKSPPLRPKHAGRVRLIDHDHGLVAIRNSE